MRHLSAVILTLFAVFLPLSCRLLQLTLPFRPRPINTAGLDLAAPYSSPEEKLYVTEYNFTQADGRNWPRSPLN